MSSRVPSPHPLSSQPGVQVVLDRLHAASLQQEQAANARLSHFPKDANDVNVFAEQLVALDEDKARAMYLILRTMGARRVVEAGTSYGVSLIWVLSAVNANLAISSTSPFPPLVIGTENEPAKAAKALAHVQEAFGTIPPSLTLLEGDILHTIPAANLPDRSIDALLLDIWAPLALPTLTNLLPKLRIGAAVFIDNSGASEGRYKDLFEFLRKPDNGFVMTTLPYSGGFELCIYSPAH
eukprot:TRINITY_DN3068_c0_g1_i2.p1 TRINITY_DN3068_c0_g1~~TRINITY_DN3068_c0_g1_i2.p1  ORF type:complete len:245 (-),score=48.25 TRINITY_DN3068_c0_g1_i2:256-969(-)